MRTAIFALCAASVLADLSACATAKGPAKPPSAASYVSSAATTTRNGAEPPAARLDPELDAQLAKQGYQRKIYRGETVYCRVESQTASRFTGRVCRTADQIRANERDARDVRGTVRSDSTCMMTKCN